MTAKIINGIFYQPSLKPPPKKSAEIIIFPGNKRTEISDAQETDKERSR